MAIIIDKNSIQHDYRPSFGEVVKHGAREGIYVGRTKSPAQVLVQWGGMGRPVVVPYACLHFTGNLDAAFLERSYAVDSPGHKGKGGLKTGGRRIKRTRADVAFKRQEIRQKKLSKGSGPGNAADEGKKFKNEIDKHTHLSGDNKTPCLGCGKRITVNDDSMEPFYCKSCQKRLGFIHVTEELK
jgi:hypothetical protein